MKGIYCWLLVFPLLVAVPTTGNVDRPRSPEEQGEWEKSYDRRNIRHSARMLRDHSPDLLKVPEEYSDILDFEVASTPPAIDFVILQNLEPEYLPPELAENAGGVWGGWGDVSRGPDGNYYFSISNHLSYGAEAYVVRYDPRTRTHSNVLSARGLAGWNPDEFGDGKIHGDIDFDPQGNTWLLTYFGPVPTEEEWNTVYRGGRLLRYNAFTEEAEDLGIPLEGDSWPYHNYDWQQNLFFSAGHRGFVLVYDTSERRVVYGGAPAGNIRWYNRCILMDRETGVIYSNDADSPEKRLVSYRRRNNRFTRLNATVPLNPRTGKRGNLRAHTPRKDAEGAFWCFDHYGTLFKFYPEEDRTEYVTENWGNEGYYTPNMAMSPGGRYLYYIPGVARPYAQGVPVVQYDTLTGGKKVLAFLYDYYLARYGYAPIRPYGIEIDESGESLVFFANGGFVTPEPDNPWLIPVRRPALFHLHIPASERVE